MHTVYCDIEITRRKRFHLIMDDNDVVIFRSRLYGEILEWLRNEGVTEYSVTAEKGDYTLQMQWPPYHKGPL